MVKSEFDYEDIYALKILEFERRQARAGLRPALPCDTRTRAMTEHEKEIARRCREKATKQRREDMFRAFLDVIEDGEAANARQIADRMGMEAQKIGNYLTIASEQGYLMKLHMVSGNMQYAYAKTGKKLEENV